MHRFGMGEMRWFLTVFLLWPLCGQAEERTVMQIETTIDFGKDVGRTGGTLFEARDAEGRVVLGAGFYRCV